jgi:hypothetical protein
MMTEEALKELDRRARMDNAVIIAAVSPAARCSKCWARPYSEPCVGCNSTRREPIPLGEFCG